MHGTQLEVLRSIMWTEEEVPKEFYSTARNVTITLK